MGSTPKETYYFVDPGCHLYNPRAHISNGLEGYRRFFPCPKRNPPKIVFESTPAYVYYKTAVQCLPDIGTHPTFLFVVREPAAQVYSLFSYLKHNWAFVPAGMRFGDFLSIVREGGELFRRNDLASNALRYAHYLNYLETWRSRVGSERMMVRVFEDLLADQRAFTQGIASWIEIDPGFYEDYTFRGENQTYAVKSKWLQKVNVSLRSLLPQGKAYDTLRVLYRLLNTRKPPAPTSEDNDALCALREEFSEHNERLAEAFDLDLRRWETHI